MAVTSDQDVNFNITQGDTFPLQFQYADVYEDDYGNEIVTPIDISGFNVLMEIKDKPGGRILSARCTVGDGIEITDAVNGIIDITISPEKTRNFNYPRASYQIQATDQYGEKIPFIKGWFKVDAGTID